MRGVDLVDFNRMVAISQTPRSMVALAALGLVLIVIGPYASLQTRLVGSSLTTIPATLMIPPRGSLPVGLDEQPSWPRGTVEIFARWRADGPVVLAVAVNHGGAIAEGKIVGGIAVVVLDGLLILAALAVEVRRPKNYILTGNCVRFHVKESANPRSP